MLDIGKPAGFCVTSWCFQPLNPVEENRFQGMVVGLGYYDNPEGELPPRRKIAAASTSQIGEVAVANPNGMTTCWAK